MPRRALVATWRATLSLPVYASDAARRFDCPSVGQGGECRSRSRASSPRWAGSWHSARSPTPRSSRNTRHSFRTPAWRTSSTTSSPPIARSSPRAACRTRPRAWRSNASRSTSPPTSPVKALTEAEPDVGIIWAVPLGHSLAERDPAWQPALKCPANDNSRVPQALVAAAAQIAGKPDPNFPATAAIAQADRCSRQIPKAKPADLANALILAFCEGVAGLAGVARRREERERSCATARR